MGGLTNHSESDAQPNVPAFHLGHSAIERLVIAKGTPGKEENPHLVDGGKKKTWSNGGHVDAQGNVGV